LNKINSYWGQEQPGKTESRTGIHLGFQVHPSIAFDHTSLWLDLDLVPYIPKGILYDSLFEIFGKANFSTNASGHL
jgi:hypothetical protein